MTPAPHKIKTGILSFGFSGKIFHAPFVAAHAGFELTAITERTKKQAQAVYPQVVSYHSVEELLTDKSIELVIVNTPNFTHHDFALKALQSGKHVLLEKPFATTVAEAEELFAEARKQNRQVLAYHNRRYDSDFLSVKKVIDSGKLGQITEAHFRFDRYRPGISPKAFKETKVPGSGLLYDLGPHLLDGLVALFGLPEKWHVETRILRDKSQVDDYFHVQLLFKNGLMAFASSNMLTAHEMPGFIINGTKGSFIKNRADVQEKQLLAGFSPTHGNYGVEPQEETGLLVTVNSEERREEKVPAAPASYIHLFEDVYNTLVHKKPYPVTEEQVLQVLEIIEGA